MRKSKRLLLVLCALVALILGAALQFFFNPMGLGPEPPAILSSEFFAQPADDLSALTLLVDGMEAFAKTLAAFDTASTAIYIQTFIWKDDAIGRHVVSGLKAAADRGVAITVRKDIVGTVFELGDLLAGKPSPVFTGAGLKNYPRIDVQLDWFAKTDHSKYFIVDHGLVILGGMNIADEYHTQWHDYMVCVQSKAWTRSFEDKVLNGIAWPAAAPFVITVNDRHATEIRTALIQMIDQAAETLIIEQAYFSDDRIIAAVLRAARRGVRVTVVLPAEPDTHGYANRVTINQLLAAEAGTRLVVFFYPAMSHAKVALADGAIAAVGSANLTPRSMWTSSEIVLFAHGRKDDAFIRKLHDQLAADIAASRQVTLPFELSFGEKVKALVGKYVW
ncbi:MAG: phosphatidylserine/phosphatidylglycerophosphate/cardiolipin synthase family protein [Desulfatitalea sp.]